MSVNTYLPVLASIYICASVCMYIYLPTVYTQYPFQKHSFGISHLLNYYSYFTSHRVHINYLNIFFIILMIPILNIKL